MTLCISQVDFMWLHPHMLYVHFYFPRTTPKLSGSGAPAQP